MKTELELKDIKIGRLQKRIRKLIQQRDFFKNEKEYFESIVDRIPYSRRSYEERLATDAQIKHYREIKITYNLLLRENERMEKEITKLKEAMNNEHS